MEFGWTGVPGASPGDFDVDGVVGLQDFVILTELFTGPCVSGVCFPCKKLTTEEFELQAFRGWGDTLDHARSLGYTEIDNAQLCNEATPGESTGVAALRNPAALPPDDKILLLFSERDRFVILAKKSADGSTTFFNQSGGVRISSDGTGELVGPDGMPPPRNSMENPQPTQAGVSAVSAECAAPWLDYLFCLARDPGVLLTFGCGAGLISLYFSGGLSIWAVAAICDAQAMAPPEPPDCLLPGPISCNRGCICSNPTTDACSFGSCIPVDALNEGQSCRDACRPEAAGAFPRCAAGERFLETLNCTNGYCSLDLVDCLSAGPSYVCSGAPGSAECADLCGNGILDAGEECDPTDDSACPGRCIPAGQEGECTCRPFDLSGAWTICLSSYTTPPSIADTSCFTCPPQTGCVDNGVHGAEFLPLPWCFVLGFRPPQVIQVTQTGTSLSGSVNTAGCAAFCGAACTCVDTLTGSISADNVAVVRTLTISATNFTQVMSYDIDGTFTPPASIAGATFSGTFTSHIDFACSTNDTNGPAGAGPASINITPAP